MNIIIFFFIKLTNTFIKKIENDSSPYLRLVIIHEKPENNFDENNKRMSSANKSF